MKKEDFENSPSGKLAPTEKGQWAFVPNELPPSNLNMAEIAEPLSIASQLLGELNGIGRTLPDPYVLIRPLQVREALTSSSMEGTHTTIDELLLLEAGGGVERSRSAEAREVANYRRALAEAIQSLDQIPLSLRTMRNAHKTLLTGVSQNRGANAQPGEFKIYQNFIGAREIENARFIPPPTGLAIEAMGALEKYIQRDDRGRIPDLIDAALIHYQFEAIHPFSDGNGRVGRMLITLHLFMRKTIRQPVLYLSPVLEQRKDEYIDLMYNVSQSGAWTAWVHFFLDVVAQASRNAIDTADALLELQKNFHSRLRGISRSANLHRIIDQLFIWQIVTIPALAEFLQVQYRSAQLNVETLTEAGILQEVQGTSNPKYFVTREVRNIINESVKLNT